ncbi:MAG: hypothetical protein R3353_00185 [Salegentibacter mishustinae]|nr:hypothetical protein [Salegentibacter mishustinae]
MSLKKINLDDFKQSQLEVSQLLEAKGGSGDSSTTSSATSCTGTDFDCKSHDCD